MTSKGYDILHASSNNFFEQPEHSEIGRKAWKLASRSAKHMSRHSKIVNPKLEKLIPRFEECEINVGKLLGTGGFNNCFELESINLLKNPATAPHARKICSETQTERRAFVAKHVHRESSNSKRYALKFLSRETISDPERFWTGAADLVVEAKFLASLEHPNIIKLRGMAAAGTSGFAGCRERGYFLVLDRLQCTLDDRLEHWEAYHHKHLNSPLRSQSKVKKFLAERLHVAFDVASALQYLHDNNIIYRDLKPDNIGFDCRGDVKLFDFGLAKELDETMKSGYCDQYYELSGNTGSLRYMAPEVALSEAYNLKADVYSFGLLLWQICSLELPYDGMTRGEHARCVVKGHERPPLSRNWSTPLRILIKRAWEPDPMLRPAMASIYKILKREISALRDGDETGLENMQRRSTFVFGQESTRSLPKGSLSSKDKSGLLDKQSNHTRTLKQSRSSRAILGLIERAPSKRSAMAA